MRLIILFISISFTLNCFSQGSGNSLSFDGTNDRISTANNILSTPTALTVELWINTSSVVGNDMIFSIEGAYFIRIYSNGNVQTVFDGSTSVNNPQRAAGVNDGNWHHLAATCDGTTTIVYVDGVNLGSQTESFLNINSINRPTAVGSQYSGGNNFSGQIDEFRIWTSVRTQTEIRDNMCQTLTGSEPNLFLYYRLNEGSGTTVTDDAGSNNGTLTNMDSATDWITSGAPIGNESIHSYTVNISTSLNLASAAGDDLTANVTALTVAPSSVHLYRVDEEPNVTTLSGTQTQLSQNTYYGVAIFDGSGVVYTTIMNYDGHDGIIDEADLELAKRDNNADATWSQEAAVLDVGANTLTLAGETGAEYILATIGSDPLPVELLSFDASAKENNTVLLEWQTASELNNDFFTILRSRNGQDWQEVNKIDGAGNSSSLLGYSEIDNNPYDGISYYRLKQTDFDGQFEYFKIRSVNIQQLVNLQIEIYPNPATNQIIIKGSSNELEKIVFYNTLGQNVTSLINQVITNENQLVIDISKLNTGMYYAKTKTTANMVYKQ